MTDIDAMIDNIGDWSDDDIVAMLVRMHDEIHRMCVEYYDVCTICNVSWRDILFENKHEIDMLFDSKEDDNQ